MSRENVIRFYEDVRKNENLKKEFESLKNNVENAKETKDESLAKKIVSIAKKNGFDFTEKELLNYMEEIKNTLSEEELLDVSGGRVSARAAGVGLMGALMLSFGTGAVFNLVGQNGGITSIQQEATLDNEDHGVKDSEIKENTDKDNNVSRGLEGKQVKRKIPAGMGSSENSMQLGRSVTGQSKLGRDLVVPQGETPTLNESNENITSSNKVRENADSRSNNPAGDRVERRAAAPISNVSQNKKHVTFNLDNNQASNFGESRVSAKPEVDVASPEEGETQNNATKSNDEFFESKSQNLDQQPEAKKESTEATTTISEVKAASPEVDVKESKNNKIENKENKEDERKEKLKEKKVGVSRDWEYEEANKPGNRPKTESKTGTQEKNAAVNENVEVKSVKNKWNFSNKYYDLDVIIEAGSDNITLNQELINKIVAGYKKGEIKPEVIRSITIKRDGSKETVKVNLGNDLDSNFKSAAKVTDNKVTIDISKATSTQKQNTGTNQGEKQNNEPSASVKNQNLKLSPEEQAQRDIQGAQNDAEAFKIAEKYISEGQNRSIDIKFKVPVEVETETGNISITGYNITNKDGKSTIKFKFTGDKLACIYRAEAIRLVRELIIREKFNGNDFSKYEFKNVFKNVNFYTGVLAKDTFGCYFGDNQNDGSTIYINFKDKVNLGELNYNSLEENAIKFLKKGLDKNSANYKATKFNLKLKYNNGWLDGEIDLKAGTLRLGDKVYKEDEAVNPENIVQNNENNYKVAANSKREQSQNENQNVKKVDDNAKNDDENAQQNGQIRQFERRVRKGNIRKPTISKYRERNEEENQATQEAKKDATVNKSVEVKSVKTTNWFGSYHDLKVTIAAGSDDITLNQELIKEISAKRKIKPEIISSITMVDENGQAVDIELGDDLDANFKATAKNEGDNKVTVNNELFKALNARDKATEDYNKAKGTYENKANNLKSIQDIKDSYENRGIVKYYNAIEKVDYNGGIFNAFASEWDLYVTMEKDSNVQVPEKGDADWIDFLLAVQARLNNTKFKFEKVRKIVVNGTEIEKFDDKTGRARITKKPDDIKAYEQVLKDLKKAEGEFKTAETTLTKAKVNLEQVEQKYFAWKKLDKPVVFKSNGKEFKITRYYVQEDEETIVFDISGSKDTEIDIDDLENAVKSSIDELKDSKYDLDIYINSDVDLSDYERVFLEDNNAVTFKIEKDILHVKKMTVAQFKGREKELVKKAVEEWADSKITETDIRAIQIDSLDGESKLYVKNENGDFVDSAEANLKKEPQKRKVSNSAEEEASTNWRKYLGLVFTAVGTAAYAYLIDTLRKTDAAGLGNGGNSSFGNFSLGNFSLGDQLSVFNNKIFKNKQYQLTEANEYLNKTFKNLKSAQVSTDFLANDLITWGENNLNKQDYLQVSEVNNTTPINTYNGGIYPAALNSLNVLNVNNPDDFSYTNVSLADYQNSWPFVLDDLALGICLDNDCINDLNESVPVVQEVINKQIKPALVDPQNSAKSDGGWKTALKNIANNPESTEDLAKNIFNKLKESGKIENVDGHEEEIINSIKDAIKERGKTALGDPQDIPELDITTNAYSNNGNEEKAEKIESPVNDKQEPNDNLDIEGNEDQNNGQNAYSQSDGTTLVNDAQKTNDNQANGQKFLKSLTQVEVNKDIEELLKDENALNASRAVVNPNPQRIKVDGDLNLDGSDSTAVVYKGGSAGNGNNPNYTKEPQNININNLQEVRDYTGSTETEVVLKNVISSEVNNLINNKFGNMTDEQKEAAFEKLLENAESVKKLATNIFNNLKDSGIIKNVGDSANEIINSIEDFIKNARKNISNLNTTEKNVLTTVVAGVVGKILGKLLPSKKNNNADQGKLNNLGLKQEAAPNLQENNVKGDLDSKKEVLKKVIISEIDDYLCAQFPEVPDNRKADYLEELDKLIDFGVIEKNIFNKLKNLKIIENVDDKRAKEIIGSIIDLIKIQLEKGSEEDIHEEGTFKWILGGVADEIFNKLSNKNDNALNNVNDNDDNNNDNNNVNNVNNNNKGDKSDNNDVTNNVNNNQNKDTSNVNKKKDQVRVAIKLSEEEEEEEEKIENGATDNNAKNDNTSNVNNNNQGDSTVEEQSSTQQNQAAAPQQGDKEYTVEVNKDVTIKFTASKDDSGQVEITLADEFIKYLSKPGKLSTFFIILKYEGPKFVKEACEKAEKDGLKIKINLKKEVAEKEITVDKIVAFESSLPE